MKVGLMLPQPIEDEAASTWPALAALARHLEAGGIDSVWVADHLFHRPGDGPDGGLHEAWTLISAVAAITERVEVGPLVLATSFRNPGLTAKMAATAHEVAGGRLILGLGCGWHEPEYRAFGYPFDHRVGRFEEALLAIKALLGGERITVDGRWTRFEDAVLVPPVPPPPPPILVAAKGDRMLRLTARHADQWQTAWFGLPDVRFRERRERLLAACDAEGRDPATLQQTVGLSIGGDDGDAERRGWRDIPLDADAVADAFATWASEGIDHVQCVLGRSDRAAFDVVLEAIARR